MNVWLIGRLMGRLAGLLAVCCITLTGCNRDPDPAPVAATATTQSAASKSSDDPMAGLVKAVTSDARHQAIDLRFDLSGRPKVGEAVDIKLVLRAIDDATDVKLSISADPKLAIIAGGDADFASIKAGEIVSHVVTLRPTSNGIIVMDAAVAATANGGPHTVSYGIPVAVVAVAASSSSGAAAAVPAPHK